MWLADSASMTAASKVIISLITAGIIGAVGTAFKLNRAAKARAVALAVAAERVSGRLDTQDSALARLLDVISPKGAPNLTEVLTRIQADQAAQATRLADHIRAAAADKAAFERRLELIGGGR